MEHLTSWLHRLAVDFTANLHSFLSGILAVFVGYFFPVADIVHLLLFFFLLDVLFGYLAAKKLRGERFSVKIIWTHTMPRMLIALVLILGSYMWDKTYQQELVSTYKLLGWFLSGLLLYSIAENGYKITHWYGFLNLKTLLKKKFEDESGTELQD